jgi:hypothetical protein
VAFLQRDFVIPGRREATNPESEMIAGFRVRVFGAPGMTESIGEH